MSANHSLQKLLDELGRLPGIGPKSAQRIAYYLLEADAEEARRLAEAILEVKQEVHFCSRCFNYATADECSICQDPMRDTTRICVLASRATSRRLSARAATTASTMCWAA